MTEKPKLRKAGQEVKNSDIIEKPRLKTNLSRIIKFPEDNKDTVQVDVKQFEDQEREQIEQMRKDRELFKKMMEENKKKVTVPQIPEIEVKYKKSEKKNVKLIEEPKENEEHKENEDGIENEELTDDENEDETIDEEDEEENEDEKQKNLKYLESLKKHDKKALEKLRDGYIETVGEYFNKLSDNMNKVKELYDETEIMKKYISNKSKIIVFVNNELSKRKNLNL